MLNDSIDDYKNDIHDELTIIKELESVGISKSESLNASQKCYLSAMKMPLKDLKGFDNKEKFFQKGMIHSIIEEFETFSFNWVIIKHNEN